MSGIDTSTSKAHPIREAVATEVAKQGFSISDILQFQTGHNKTPL